MSQPKTSHIAPIIEKYETELLEDWIQSFRSHSIRMSNAEEASMRRRCAQFLNALKQSATQDHFESIDGREWNEARALLSEISQARVKEGSSPTETAMFIFSLKQPLFARLRIELDDQPQTLAENTWSISSLLDKFGLFTMEVFQKSREQIITRQQQELLELSTPVVKLWHNILALPLIGTLDSARTQIVMESLLEKIIETGSSIAIIDISGVPTVDTLVAQHLLKTVAATRLMGADCIISGIRPQIAQTIVQLGVNLEDVITKATLADAFLIALERTGANISRAHAHA